MISYTQGSHTVHPGIVSKGQDPHDPPADETHDELFTQRHGPGLLVIAAPMRLVYMNQRAREIILAICEAEQTEGTREAGPAKGLLPRGLLGVCKDIFDYIRRSQHGKDLERFQLTQVIGDPSRPFLVRGFGMPDGSTPGKPRALLVMEEIALRRNRTKPVDLEQWQLTPREQAVVQCLAKGWTNKEISGSLNLALPTVKEHIRHIMEKTGTTTRTGILMKVFAGGPS